MIDNIDMQHYFTVAQTNYALFSLWVMLSYLYFSIKKKPISTTVTVNDNNNNTSNDTENQLEDEVNANSAEQKTSNDFIFNSQRIIGTPMMSTERGTATATETVAQQPKYSFNIFDGTGASGAFAEFIHDGDSDDENEDNAQTDHWAAVQDHI